MVTTLDVEVIHLKCRGTVSWRSRLSLYQSDWTCWMNEERVMLVVRFLSTLDAYDDAKAVKAKRAWSSNLPLKVRLHITRVCRTLP